MKMLKARSMVPRLAVVVLAATAISACGSAAHHQRSSSAGSQTVSLNGIRMTVADANAAMLRFARCMKTHGVNGLPNPVASPAAFKQSFTTTTPVYRSALGTCQRLIPGQENDQSAAHTRKRIDAALAFARCMRGHGFSRFPDPTRTGDLTHQMLAAAGIDLHQPAVVGAADACTSVTHGLITRAVIARFIASH